MKTQFLVLSVASALFLTACFHGDDAESSGSCLENLLEAQGFDSEQEAIDEYGASVVAAQIEAACPSSSNSGGSGSDLSDEEDVANEFTQQVSFGGGTQVNTAPPAITFTGTRANAGLGATVGIDEPDAAATVVTAGATSQMTVPMTGVPVGTNFTVNINFGTAPNTFVSVPVSNGVYTGGGVNIPMTIPLDICDNLADIQHQIRCYESVTLPDGTVMSTSQARLLTLQCDTSGSALGAVCSTDSDCVSGLSCQSGVCVGDGALRFSMSWDGSGDYDLYVTTPNSSEISYTNRTADGGTLDQDDIAGGPGSVENIFFNSNLSNGTYSYRVDDLSGNGPWTLQVFESGVLQATQNGSGDSAVFTHTY